MEKTNCRFELNKEYFHRWIGDSQMRSFYTVTKISASRKSIWIQEEGKTTSKMKRIKTDRNGNESCDPNGSYSMAPTLSANNLCYESMREEYNANTHKDYIIDRAEENRKVLEAQKEKKVLDFPVFANTDTDGGKNVRLSNLELSILSILIDSAVDSQKLSAQAMELIKSIRHKIIKPSTHPGG